MSAFTSIVVALLMLDIGMRLQEYLEHLRYRRISRNVMQEVRETEQWKQEMEEILSDTPTPQGRAVTAEEKREIIERLLSIWQANPALRLSQLLLNCFKGDWYYVEDYALIEQVRATYEQAERCTQEEEKAS